MFILQAGKSAAHSQWVVLGLVWFGLVLFGLISFPKEIYYFSQVETIRTNIQSTTAQVDNTSKKQIKWTNNKEIFSLHIEYHVIT